MIMLYPEELDRMVMMSILEVPQSLLPLLFLHFLVILPLVKEVVVAVTLFSMTFTTGLL
jgi:hypothetical protein